MSNETFSHRLVMEKMLSEDSDLTFGRLFVRLADNQDSHKISVGFEFWPDRNIHFGVTMYLPFSAENRHIRPCPEDSDFIFIGSSSYMYLRITRTAIK